MNRLCFDDCFPVRERTQVLMAEEISAVGANLNRYVVHSIP